MSPYFCPPLTPKTLNPRRRKTVPAKCTVAPKHKLVRYHMRCNNGSLLVSGSPLQYWQYTDQCYNTKDWQATSTTMLSMEHTRILCTPRCCYGREVYVTTHHSCREQVISHAGSKSLHVIQAPGRAMTCCSRGLPCLDLGGPQRCRAFFLGFVSFFFLGFVSLG